jgi:hypothetical protein
VEGTLAFDELRGGEFRQFRKYCNQRRCPPFVTALAAFVNTLERIDQRRDHVVNILTPNRAPGDGADMVACLAVLLFVRIRTKPEMPLDELISHLQKRLLESVAHRQFDHSSLRSVMDGGSASAGGWDNVISFNLVEERPPIAREYGGVLKRLEPEDLGIPVGTLIPSGAFSMECRMRADSLYFRVLWDNEGRNLDRDAVCRMVLEELRKIVSRSEIRSS